jgi:hypothetical protein
MAGKQLRLFLVDGSPGGLSTAEIMNWTGHVVSGPRSDIGQLLQRDEVHRTGVYVLLGDDAEAPGGVAIYVGEGDEVATRLRQHARGEEQGGKDFWDRVIVITSKDANLTKAHARYLESRMIATATDASRSRLVNGTAPPPILLPEADAADMEYFLTQVLIVLSVLGVSAFRIARPQVSAAGVTPATEPPVSPTFFLEVPKNRIRATARQIDGEFTVLEGSVARGSWQGTHRHPGYRQLHSALLADGSLIIDDGGLARFSRDVAFSSPSAAAAVVTGRAANGRTAWVAEESGMMFGDWESRGVN